MQSLFKSSINIQFDIDNVDILERYILTPSHANAVKGILTSSLQFKGMNSHILIGPYGTGKSLVSSIIAKFLSKSMPEELFQRLSRESSIIDTQLANTLTNIQSSDRRFIPVLINGKTGDLRKNIINAILVYLNKVGVEITIPNEVTSIIKTVKMWKNEFPLTFIQFENYLTTVNLEYAAWIEEIKSYNEKLIKEFHVFYPSVTSGSTWKNDDYDNFIENIQKVLTDLDKIGLGIVLIYDEFGRFLQFAQSDKSYIHLQNLQDLAELANSSLNFQFIIINHKSIRQYSDIENVKYKVEFEKVEKRFTPYYFENDPNSYLRLAYESLKTVNELCWNERKEDEIVEIDTVQKFQFLNDYSMHQIEEYIIKGMYPVHPVTVTLLPHLSNILGQNERTLFSFLEGEERFGLNHHVLTEEGYYYGDKLFSYFVDESDEYPAHPTLQLYKKLTSNINNSEQIRLIQFITLWKLANLGQKQTLITSFISFALGQSISKTDKILKQLTLLKIVRFNEITKQWELYEGSSIDLESVIEEKRMRMVLNRHKKIDIINAHLDQKYVLSYEYNDEIGMLRYANINFIWAEETQVNHINQNDSDDHIHYILLQNKMDIDKNHLKSGLYVVPKFDIISIEEHLYRFAIVDQLINDPIFISNDDRLKNELNFIVEQIKSKIKKFINKYRDFNQVTWYEDGKVLNIDSYTELEQVISNRMYNKYSRTPVIRNEAFNRRNITGIQKRAAIEVTDHLLNNPEELQIGIVGHGPSYLIYASVLKNNGYKFQRDSIQMNSSLLYLREVILTELKNNPSGNLQNLIKIFTEPPFGLRASVIPVLFVALIRDKWEQLMFYSHDMHISSITGKLIYEMIDRANEYDYIFYNLDDTDKQELDTLSRVFNMEVNDTLNLIQISNSMIEWLRKLPRFTQQTNSMSVSALELRNLIRSSEIDPYRLVRELKMEKDILLSSKKEIESFMELNQVFLINQIILLTDHNTLKELYKFIFARQVEVVGLNSKLLTLPRDIDLNDESQLLEDLVVHLIGVARCDWSDATQELFLKQFSYEWQLLNSNEVATAVEENTLVPEVELSKKSQVLYTNVKNLLKYAGKDVTTQEIKYLLMKLIQETE